MPPRVSIVLAAQHAPANVPEFLRRVQPEQHADLEVLICSAGSLEIVGQPENVEVIHGPPDALIPELWAMGFRAARAPLVATTTAHCLPDERWVDVLRSCVLTTNLAAMGGCIVADPRETVHARAIYHLRYSAFAPDRKAGEVEHVAADNAVYVRDAVLAEDDLLAEGFWEPDFHSRFKQQGLGLSWNPELRVVHANQYSPAQFAQQRLAHGKAFGRARIADAPWPKRFLFACAGPALVGVFFLRVLARAGAGSLGAPLPHLVSFVFHWGLGETSSYWRSLVRR